MSHATANQSLPAAADRANLPAEPFTGVLCTIDGNTLHYDHSKCTKLKQNCSLTLTRLDLHFVAGVLVKVVETETPYPHPTVPDPREAARAAN